MTTRPVVSALMIVHNRADLLTLAALSVLSQVGPPLELLIVDDGSTDGSAQIAEQLAVVDDRVVTLPSLRCGIPASRNRGLAAARGPYLAICDSDDLSRPGRFRAQVAALEAAPDLAGVGSRVNCFSDEPTNGHVEDWRWGLRGGRGPFAFPSAMLRTSAVRGVGGFNPAYEIVEDLELCYRLAGRGWDFDLLPDVLVDYRVSGQGVSAGNLQLFRYTARAQLRGLLELRGGFTPRGYATVAQSLLRAGRDAYRSRFSAATIK